MKYIDADKLIAEIERQQRKLMLLSNTEQVSIRRDCALQNAAYSYILSIISSLQQEPRFPKYDNIVDKVFGAGNLEDFEYREAEMLVALAKEELLKSLQQEQTPTEREIAEAHRYAEMIREWDKARIQQEQPEFPTTDEEVEKALSTIPEAELPDKYKTPDWLFEKREQPEVDLEKFTEKIKTFQGRYKHPEIVSIKGAMAFMARMFYQYPNVARQWYDNLPKTTMD